MARQIALLRGVNVGGARKLPMADLRALFESLGYTDVATLIQSGNVVFTAKKAATPAALERAIAKHFGLDVTIVVRTPQQLARTLRSNPFADAPTESLHFGFMSVKPSNAAVKRLDAERFLPDEFAVRGTDLYLHLHNGMGRSKLPVYLDRQLEIPTTIRNWNTVTKLLDLVSRGSRAPSDH